MTNAVSISNRALQILGVDRIAALDEDSKGARECSACYDDLRRAELRINFWAFAIKRVEIATVVAPDPRVPIFGPAYAYPLPHDFLRIAPNCPAYSELRGPDTRIEGQCIVTNATSPLQLRYVADVTSGFDALFSEGLSGRMALTMAETLTQSSSKADAAGAIYKLAIDQARRTNAIEAGPVQQNIDPWQQSRGTFAPSDLGGTGNWWGIW